MKYPKLQWAREKDRSRLSPSRITHKAKSLVRDYVFYSVCTGAERDGGHWYAYMHVGTRRPATIPEDRSAFVSEAVEAAIDFLALDLSDDSSLRSFIIKS